MRAPERADLTKLAAWRPGRGVVSAYLAIDPADRREGWRIELRDCLDRIVRAADHADRAALQATADRIRARLSEQVHPSGRCQIGFVEVAERAGVERWYAVQLSPCPTLVVHHPRPHLRPLVEILDAGSPVGIVAVSSERIKVFEWALGFIEDLEVLDTGVFRGGWRERKGPAPRDPARGQGVSSSGKDQHDQRLEANRERFVTESGKRIDELATRRRWRTLFAFGDKGHVSELAACMGDGHELVVAGESNLVNEERAEVAKRAVEAVERFNRRRELELVRAATDAALSEQGRGSVGLEPTRSALREGRVGHLIIDAARERRPEERGADNGLDEEIAEQLIEAALQTGAEVTPVEGDAAAALDEHGGVAALLRY